MKRTVTFTAMHILVVSGVLAVSVPAPAQQTEALDCKSLEKISRKNAMKADPKIVEQCQTRGGDPPLGWLRDGGETAGIRAGGSSGMTTGAINSPEGSPSARRTKASVSRERILHSCNFPPNVRFKLSGGNVSVQLPQGSCWEFMAGLFKDVSGSGATGSALTPPVNNDACLAETDITGLFGVKQAPSNTTLTCGAMVPTTALDVVLNPNPVGLAATEEGAYHLWAYRKDASGYVLTADSVALPRYLCTEIELEAGKTWQKSVDLTPPVAQMITYGADATHISVRLKSRETMDSNFIPPYQEDEPEKYLVIPLVNGVLEIPNDCASDQVHFREMDSRQDIVVHSSTHSGCEGPTVSATNTNDAKAECPTGAIRSEGTGKCYDANGKEVAAIIKDNWKKQCPGGVAPVNGVCPQQEAIDNAKEQMVCSTGVGNLPSTNCDMATISLTGTQCEGKVQYGVLDRPNLYYPPGTTTRFLPIAGRTAKMADTVAGNQFFTQSQTSFFLQPTAPLLKFKEGGFIKLKDNSTVIMEQDSTVTMSTRQIHFPMGGDRVSRGGTQLESFAAGSSYTIPQDLMTNPLIVSVGRSVEIPVGYAIPTAPNPYLRLPAAKPPE